MFMVLSNDTMARVHLAAVGTNQWNSFKGQASKNMTLLLVGYIDFLFKCHEKWKFASNISIAISNFNNSF